MVHLHMRSSYSLLESSIRLEQMIVHQKQLGFRHVCLTDHNVMYGTMEFYHLCKKHDMHPIFGLEVSVKKDEDIFNFILLAKNDLGLQNLYELTSIITDFIKFSEFVEYTKECIVLTSSDGNDAFSGYIENQNVDSLISFVEECTNSFSDFYVSVAMNDSNKRREDNKILNSLSCKKVALSRIYYENKEDVKTLQALRAIAKQTYMDDQSLDVKYNRHLRSMEEMGMLYSQEELKTTEEIALKCNVQMAFQKSKLPVFKNKLGISSDDYLIKLCKKGLEKRLNGHFDQEYIKRLQYELDVIIKMGFTDYFLIVWDFIRYARSQDIYVGPGRGSAAGSLVAYCLGITHIDPIQNNLLFERFLNPERISMPDIDTDFPDDRREEVIQYVEDLYGKEHVSHIVTFNTLQARQALRDVGRVMNIPIRVIDEVVKLLGNKQKITLHQAYTENKTFRIRIDQDKKLHELFELACAVEGLPRHTSLHAAGIVLSDQSIVNVCPLIQIDSQVQATQFTASYLEELGLIKMDFLGLRNLTTIHEIVSKLNENENVLLDMMKIDLEDDKTYNLLANGDTLGVFQLESSGITQLLMKMKPTKFEDISTVLALYRPGAMQHIQEYLERRQDSSKIHYLHPMLEPILKDTYGIMIYQEQVMKVAQVIGGFTLAQADTLRKAMSKKNADTMSSFKEQFILGARKNKIKDSISNQIFSMMEQFAGYGFNKSHSYAYSLISYQMAYLKANYPLYFYQSVLNSVIGSATKTSQYIYECRKRGLEVLPCDVNQSKEYYELEEGSLRMPLQVLKGVGKTIYPSIVGHGPYEDLFDFLAKVSVYKVSESTIRILIDGGALDQFGYNRATLHENLRKLMDYINIVRIEDPNDLRFDFSIVSKPNVQRIKENVLQKANREHLVYGFYLSEHPVHQLRMEKYSNCISINRALSQMGYMSLIVQVASFRTHKTKKGDWMCFLSVEDEAGKMDAVIMPNLYKVEKENIKKDRICLIQGKKERETSIIVNKMTWIDVEK